jgi:phosphonate transport system substrate-binding protein
MSSPLISRVATFIFLIAFGGLAWAQAPATLSVAVSPLRLGIIPTVSARVILTNYQPMRTYLETELGEPVELQTATDFRAFHARTRANEFDVIVTAVNLARVAQVDHRWVPIAIFEPPILGVLVKPKNSPHGGVAGLKGKNLALANPQSLIALRGFVWLAEKGLRKDVDYTPVQARNDDSLGTLLNSPDTPYAMMSMGEFRVIPEATRANLEIETEFAKVPGFVSMHAPGLAAARAAQVKAALLKFGESAQGKQFFELSGVRAVRTVQAGELEALDPFVAPTRTGLE